MYYTPEELEGLKRAGQATGLVWTPMNEKQLREQNYFLRQSIEHLRAEIARLQSERWQLTIAGEPGCDDEVTWQQVRDNQ
jgi:hypothetical protein